MSNPYKEFAKETYDALCKINSAQLLSISSGPCKTEIGPLPGLIVIYDGRPDPAKVFEVNFKYNHSCGDVFSFRLLIGDVTGIGDSFATTNCLAVLQLVDVQQALRSMIPTRGKFTVAKIKSPLLYFDQNGVKYSFVMEERDDDPDIQLVPGVELRRVQEFTESYWGPLFGSFYESLCHVSTTVGKIFATSSIRFMLDLDEEVIEDESKDHTNHSVE